MKIMFIDFETQGLPHNSNITEVGFVTYTLSPGNYSLDKEFSSLVWDSSYLPQNKEIIELTGITDEMLKNEGKTQLSIIELILKETIDVDYVFAHNAAFDQGIFNEKVARFGKSVNPKRWVCTLNEIPYDKKFKCRKLSHLAYDHGIIVDPSTLHRALDDVKLLARLILEKYSVPEIIEYSIAPWKYLRVVIPAPWTDGGLGKDWAKDNGYSWEVARGTETPRFDKCWVKRVKEFEVDKQPESPYQIVVLQ